MANRFIHNKEIVKYAENYYKIINEEFYSDDKMSNKIVDIYREYIFSVKVLNDSNVRKIKKIDKIIYKYFNDFEFKKELSQGMLHMKTKRSSDNLFECIVDSIIAIYDKYIESYTRNIYIPKWI